MKKISLCKPFIEEQDIQAVSEVLKSGWLTHGPKNKELENLFSEYLGVKHAIAMNSCTTALFLALKTNNISGDVLLPSFTFAASANSVVLAGGRPVFIDIRYDDCNLDPDLLEDSLTAHTEAIMPVHFAGQCCQMSQIAEFAKKHNLLLIEDSAETLGGTFGGKYSGSWGIGCFSFFPTKNITTGEGGMLTTNDDELAAKIRFLVAHGIRKSTIEQDGEIIDWRREAVMAGFNFRLSDILAAIGVEQMKKIDRMNDLRRQNSFYLLDKLGDIDEFDLPWENEKCRHVYQMFTVKLNKGSRDELVLYLRKKGIEASVHFDPPVHHHPAYTDIAKIALPVTEKVARSIFTLPMHPSLSQDDLDYMVTILKEFLAHG